MYYKQWLSLTARIPSNILIDSTLAAVGRDPTSVIAYPTAAKSRSD